MISNREEALVQAVKRAIPWLVLLGDYIGNGTVDAPNGRCEAIASLRAALGIEPTSQACQLGYHHQCPGENTLGTSKCKCECHATKVPA